MCECVFAHTYKDHILSPNCNVQKCTEIQYITAISCEQYCTTYYTHTHTHTPHHTTPHTITHTSEYVSASYTGADTADTNAHDLYPPWPHVLIYKHTYTHTYTHNTHTHIHTYIHTYTHTHTFRQRHTFLESLRFRSSTKANLICSRSANAFAALRRCSSCCSSRS